MKWEAEKMKTIIVYYSLEGNTDHAAKALAAELGADLLRLETVTPYPTTGAKKFLLGGRDAMTGVKPELKPYTFEADAYDTVVIGTPLWAWTYAPALATFLADNDVKGKKLALMVTSMGGQDGKCFEKLEAQLGVKGVPHLSLLEPKKRAKAENGEAVRQFAKQIKQL